MSLLTYLGATVPHHGSSASRNMGILETGPFVDSAYLRALPGQFVRELLKNCLEAAAKNVYLGPSWVEVVEDGVYKFLIADDGPGMSKDKLPEYFANLSASGKTISVDGNFGLGAKVTTLSKSPLGMIVMSKVSGSPWYMIHIRRKDKKHFALEMLDVPEEDDSEESKLVEVAPVPSEYVAMFPRLFSKTRKAKSPDLESGTMVLLVGRTLDEDTWASKDKDEFNQPCPVGVNGSIRQHVRSLNRRFFSIPESVTVQAVEFQKATKSSWPKNIDDKEDKYQLRGIEGAQPWLEKYAEDKGSMEAPNGKLHWYVVAEKVVRTIKEQEEEEAKLGGSGAKKFSNLHAFHETSGFIGTLHRSSESEDVEIYDFHSSKTPAGRALYDRFRVPTTAVQKRLFILIEPTGKKNGEELFTPNSDRKGLEFCKGPFPWEQYGECFGNKMPKAIRAAIDASFPKSADSDKVCERVLQMLEGVSPPHYHKDPKSKITVFGAKGHSKETQEGTGTGHGGGGKKGGSTVVPLADYKQKLKVKAIARKPKCPEVMTKLSEDPDAQDFKDYIGKFYADDFRLCVVSDHELVRQQEDLFLRRYPGAKGYEGTVHKYVLEGYQLHLLMKIAHAYQVHRRMPGFNEAILREAFTPVNLTLMAAGVDWMSHTARIQNQLKLQKASSKVADEALKVTV